jgi:hypothetical protein
MNIYELSGAALDWAVAKCEGFEAFTDGISWIIDHAGSYQPLPKYSSDWAQGGPIIERELIRLDTACNYTDGKWKARIDSVGGWWPGETPLIAAMRCYVASKLGDEIELPEELKCAR